jgi:hypothetical protein
MKAFHIIILSFSFLLSYCQEKGYYVENGSYYSTYIKIFREKCFIYESPNTSDYRILLPSQIDEAGVTNGVTFISKDVEIGGVTERIFLERFYTGEINIYYLHSGSGKRFFIESDSIGFREEPVLSNKYELRRFLRGISSDCEYVIPEVEKVLPTKYSIARFFKKYENCIVRDKIIWDKDFTDNIERKEKTIRHIDNVLDRDVLRNPVIDREKGFYIMGRLRNIGYLKLYTTECHVYLNERDIEYEAYTPEQIDTVISGEDIFISREIETDSLKHKVFLELVHSGKYNVYKIKENALHSYYYIESDTMDFHLEPSMSDPELLPQFLFSITSDCPHVASLAGDVIPATWSVKHFFELYDECQPGTSVHNSNSDQLLLSSESVNNVRSNASEKKEKYMKKRLSEGYIYRNMGDTIQTLIKKGKEKNYYQRCSYIEPGTQVLITVSANQIGGYIAPDKSLFRSKSIKLGNDIYTKFLKVLEEGNVTLYKYEERQITRFFFEKKGMELVEINNKGFENEIPKKQYIGKIKFIFGDKPTLYPLIEQSNFSEDDFVRIVKEYNSL